MSLYDELPTIRTQIIVRNGQHLTRVWRNRSIVCEVLTDPSQIRTEKSLLWRPKKNKGD